MAQAPATIPGPQDFVDLTKAQADKLVKDFKAQKEAFKDDYDMEIIGPVETVSGPTPAPEGSKKYTVKVRFKAKN